MLNVARRAAATSPADEVAGSDGEQSHQRDIFAVTMIVVAGHVTGVTFEDGAGARAEFIPDAGAAAVFARRALDLIGRSRSAPEKILRKRESAPVGLTDRKIEFRCSRAGAETGRQRCAGSAAEKLAARKFFGADGSGGLGAPCARRPTDWLILRHCHAHKAAGLENLARPSVVALIT